MQEDIKKRPIQRGSKWGLLPFVMIPMIPSKKLPTIPIPEAAVISNTAG